jgi:hypothetical protein
VRETQQAWSNREYVGESMEQCALRNAHALGGVEILRQLIEEIEKLMKDVTDDE